MISSKPFGLNQFSFYNYQVLIIQHNKFVGFKAVIATTCPMTQYLNYTLGHALCNIQYTLDMFHVGVHVKAHV